MENQAMLAYLDGCYDTGDETAAPSPAFSVSNAKRVGRIKGFGTGRTHVDAHSATSSLNRSSQKVSGTGGREKKVRREIANSNERKRMQSINDGFQCLRVLLPQTDAVDKLSKAAILQQACNYISALLDERQRLLELNSHIMVKLAACGPSTTPQSPPPSPTPSIVRRKWSMDSSTDDPMEFALKDVEMEEMTNNSLLVKMERDLAPDNFLQDVIYESDGRFTKSPPLQSTGAQMSDRNILKRRHEQLVRYNESRASLPDVVELIKKAVDKPPSESVPCIPANESISVIGHDTNRVWSKLNSPPSYLPEVKSPSLPVVSSDCSLFRQNLATLLMASQHVDSGSYLVSDLEKLSHDAAESVDSDRSCGVEDGGEFYVDHRQKKQILHRHRLQEQARLKSHRDSSSSEGMCRDAVAGAAVVVRISSENDKPWKVQCSGSVRIENKKTPDIEWPRQTGNNDHFNFCIKRFGQDCQCALLRRSLNINGRASMVESMCIDTVV